MSGATAPRFLTTLAYTRRPAWIARAEIVDPPRLGSRAALARLVREAGRYEALVLNGSRRLDQLAAAAIARRRRPPATVLLDATWKAGSGKAERAARRAAIRALDHRNAHYCVLTEAERQLFPATWPVPLERVHVTPFHWVLSEEQLAEPAPRDGGVFAGGNSLRDHGPLVEAARRLDAPVTIASSVLPDGPLPPNVTAGPVSAERYDDLFRRATVVVVALEPRADRSAGQQTYLNAMVLGKPVIVADALGVSEYVVDGETGLVVPPRDARALGGALRWVIDPDNADAVRAMGERARAVALERFGPETYAERLLEVVDMAVAARR
jgi:glycosyltransferase involved in cell wall biosynthesis